MMPKWLEDQLAAEADKQIAKGKMSAGKKEDYIWGTMHKIKARLNAKGQSWSDLKRKKKKQ
jgi:hypothetical protein